LIGRVVIQGIFEEQFTRMCLELIWMQTVLFWNFGFKYCRVAVEAPCGSHGGVGGWGVGVEGEVEILV